MKRFFAVSFVALLALAGVVIGQERRFTIDDLLKVRRVGDPQVSPKGDMVAFTITNVDKTANKSTTQIYVVPLGGGEVRQLTNDEHSSASPRWSPDSEKLAFISARDGEDQIWTIDVSSGALKKITSISTGAGDPVWSPDGNWLAFASDIYPECPSDACNKKRVEEKAQSKVKAHVATHLLYRHWKAWKDGTRSHVFVVSANGGEARDLTPGDYDAPPFSLGGPTDYAFSPDSKELAFVSNHDKVEAISTNADVWIVSVRGGTPKNVTAANRGFDGSPQYSPDGRFIAYRSQATPGFESDRFRLMLYDRRTGTARSLSESLDSWVDEFTFAPNSQTIYLTAEERGRQPIYSVSVSGGSVRKVVSDGFNGEPHVTKDGSTLVFSRSSMTTPNEVYRANIDGSGVTELSKTNDTFISPFNLKPAEEVTWTGGLGRKVAGWILKPANFNPRKKWPLVVLIHGGPQGAWNDNWGYRWNPQVWANNGYVVFTTNPLDYRVPEGEGMQLFTAVQRMGVESKLMDFPDEGHWVLKPANSQFWHNTVLEWMDKHLK